MRTEKIGKRGFQLWKMPIPEVSNDKVSMTSLSTGIDPGGDAVDPKGFWRWNGGPW